MKEFDLSEIPEELREELRELLVLQSELIHQPDRVAAIVAASLVQDSLMGMIRVRFARDDDTTMPLFKIDGALGSFSVASRLAYALGTISRDVYDDADYIRRIRNKFAHKPFLEDSQQRKQVATFSVQQISDLCGNLKCPDRIDPGHLDAMGVGLQIGAFAWTKSPRGRFLITCMSLVFYFESATAANKLVRNAQFEVQYPST